MEIKDIVVDVECMEAVHGGQTANIAQSIGGRTQLNLGLNAMGDSVGGTQQLGQYNEDHSVNTNSAEIGQNKVFDHSTIFTNSIVKSGWLGRW